ncbi:MAG: sugar ABC transporter permease, partial [Clostridia bacterium]|nr:sugar ABC transporter permease [Clostridia bacterium]
MQKTASMQNGMKATRRRENIAGYLFMLPSLLFFFGFVIFPMVMCLVNSFFDYTMTDFSFIGLSNYSELI